MRLVHLARVTSVFIGMVAPAVQPRAAGSAGSPASGVDESSPAQRRLRTSRVDRALDDALLRMEQGVGTGTAFTAGRSAVTLGGTATSSSAVSAENNSRDAAFEAPIWGDRSGGVELDAAASAVRTLVAPSKGSRQPAAASVSKK